MQPEVFTAICSEIVKGASAKKAAQTHGLTDEAFFMHMSRHPESREQYTRARDMRADTRFESVSEIQQEVRTGKLDANAARVIIDAIKWQCGRESPKRYSERLELAGDKDNPLAVSWVDVQRTLRERRAKRTKDSGTEPTEA